MEFSQTQQFIYLLKSVFSWCVAPSAVSGLNQALIKMYSTVAFLSLNLWLLSIYLEITFPAA